MDGGRVNFLGILYQLVATGAELVDYKAQGDGEGAEFEGFIYPEFQGADNAFKVNGKLTLQQMKCSGAAAPNPFDRSDFLEIIKSAAKTLTKLEDKESQVQVYQIVTNRGSGKIQEFIDYRESNSDWTEAGVPDCLKDEPNNTKGTDDSKSQAEWTLNRWLRTILGVSNDTDPLVGSAIKFLTILQVKPQDLTAVNKKLFSWYRRYGFGRDEASAHINTLVGELVDLSAQGGGKISLTTLLQRITGATNGCALDFDELGPALKDEINRWANQRVDSWNGSRSSEHFIPDFWDWAISQITVGEPSIQILPTFDEETPKKSFLFHAQGGRGKTSGLIYIAKQLHSQRGIVIPLDMTSAETTDVNRAIDICVRAIAGWSETRANMVDRLILANPGQAIYLVVDGLNEKVGTIDGSEYAKTFDSLSRTKDVKVIMSLRSDEGKKGPDPNDIPTTEIIEIKPISAGKALKHFGFADFENSSGRDRLIGWPNMTEPLLFNVLCGINLVDARKAVEMDGPERLEVVATLCDRVALRAKKKLGVLLSDHQTLLLLATLVESAANGTTPGALPALKAYEVAMSFGASESFVNELIQVGFMDRDRISLRFRYSDEFGHIRTWANGVLNK